MLNGGSEMGSRRQKKINKTDGFVAVIVADSYSQAEEYEYLLNRNDIPAKIKEDSDDQTYEDFTVLVPEEYLDHAQVIIESETFNDDFYGIEFDFENDENIDLKYDLLEDF